MQSKVNMELSSSIKTTLADGLSRQRSPMVSAVHAVSAVACTAALSRSSGMASDTPPKGNRAAPWDCDGEVYKGRNMVERVFNRMKHYRKAATRHDGPDEGLWCMKRLPDLTMTGSCFSRYSSIYSMERCSSFRSNSLSRSLNSSCCFASSVIFPMDSG